MKIIKFKKGFKTSRETYEDLQDFLSEIDYDELTKAALDFRELRDDEITPEIAAKIEEAQKMSDKEFIRISTDM